MAKQPSVRTWVVLGIVLAVVSTLVVIQLIKPPRGEVLVIGDSLTAFARATGLSNDDWDIDARPGRKTSEGIEVARRRQASRYPVVIVALGSNDNPRDRGAYGQQMDKMMDIIGPKPHVVWVNVDTGAKGLRDAGVVNEAIGLAAQAYPNVEIGDWDTYRKSVAGFDDLRAPDGVHYDVGGSELRARWTLLVGAQALAQVKSAAADR